MKVARTVNSDPEKLEELKQLLLKEDREQVQDAIARLEELRAYAGPAHLERTLGEVLPKTFRNVNSRERAALASAMGPIMVSTIRKEMANSREEMIEVLYPITGRLVSASVRDSFRKLTRQINARLDALTSARHWSLWLKSVITGRPIGALVLAEIQAAGLKRIFLLERQSGILLARWGDSDELIDDDLVSSMIAAITTFADDAYAADEESSLRSLDFNGRNLILHASPAHIVVVECSGAMRAREEKRIHDACVWFLEEHNAPGNINNQGEGKDDKLLIPLADRLRYELDTRRRQGTQKINITAIVIVALAALGLTAALWGTYQKWRIGQATDRIERAIEANSSLAAYPVQIDANVREQKITVKGVLPLNADVAETKMQIIDAARPVSATVSLAQVASAEDISQLSRGIAQQMTEFSSTIRDTAKNTTGGDTEELHALGLQIATLEKQLAGMQQWQDDPLFKLRSFTSEHVIFFSVETSFRNPEVTEAALDQLAELIMAVPQMNIHVVGYTDAVGTEQSNLLVAMERADLVTSLLIQRGVPSERLIAVGRGSERLLENIKGAGSQNRRVEFELQNTSLK